VGEEYWLVFINEGDAFADQPVEWAIPGLDYDGAETFDLFAKEADCTNGNQPEHDTIDIDGDGQLELVITDVCDTGGNGDVGEIHWLVYDNNGAGFDAGATLWQVPGATFFGEETFDRFTAPSDCGSDATPAYDLADLDGDGAIDLVVTDHCSVVSIGETLWRFHPNTGSGFALAPETFALPGDAYDGDDSFPTLTEEVDCTGGDEQPGYALVDLDADGDPDLVVLDLCDPNGTGDVGEEHWLVYLNRGDGVGDTPVLWSLPGAQQAGDETFDLLERVANCSTDGRPTHGLFDGNGDGRPDLVIADECDPLNDDVGELHWVVYLNQGNGFQQTEQLWLIPGVEFPGGETFDTFSAVEDCGVGVPSYDVIDLNGDGVDDLVITDICSDTVLGETIWGLAAATCPN
jgi:hypothetical protein